MWLWLEWVDTHKHKERTWGVVNISFLGYAPASIITPFQEQKGSVFQLLLSPLDLINYRVNHHPLCCILHSTYFDPWPQWVKDLALLWLWPEWKATAPIWPLAREPPYAVSAALKRQKTKKKKKKKSFPPSTSISYPSTILLLLLSSQPNFFKEFLHHVLILYSFPLCLLIPPLREIFVISPNH